MDEEMVLKWCTISLLHASQWNFFFLCHPKCVHIKVFTLKITVVEGKKINQQRPLTSHVHL
jgi:hypothetical protein